MSHIFMFGCDVLTRTENALVEDSTGLQGDNPSGNRRELVPRMLHGCFSVRWLRSLHVSSRGGVMRRHVVYPHPVYVFILFAYVRFLEARLRPWCSFV